MKLTDIVASLIGKKSKTYLPPLLYWVGGNPIHHKYYTTIQALFWYIIVLLQYGDEHLKEIEDLWSALCRWPQNIRSTLNFLARLTCVSSNLHLMLQQAKRIMVCFSRTKPTALVAELMRDLRVR